MSSCARLAAMTPATCAVVSTLPLAISPRESRRSVSGFITTRPLATATRTVSSFAVTSTMRARPASSMWERRWSVTSAADARHLDLREPDGVRAADLGVAVRAGAPDRAQRGADLLVGAAAAPQRPQVVAAHAE